MKYEIIVEAVTLPHGNLRLEIFTRNRVLAMFIHYHRKDWSFILVYSGTGKRRYYMRQYTSCTVRYIFRSYHSFPGSVLTSCFAEVKMQQGNYYHYVTSEINFKNVYTI